MNSAEMKIPNEFRLLSLDAWMLQFKPLVNKRAPETFLCQIKDGPTAGLFNPGHPEDSAFIKENEESNPGCVWTLQSSGEETITNGIHTINCESYLITEIACPVNMDVEVETMDDFDKIVRALTDADIEQITTFLDEGCIKHGHITDQMVDFARSSEENDAQEEAAQLITRFVSEGLLNKDAVLGGKPLSEVLRESGHDWAADALDSNLTDSNTGHPKC